MSSLGAAAVFATVTLFTHPAPPAEGDDAEAHLTAKAETCISRGAAMAERLDPSLTDAADFLLTYLCAAELSARQKYQTNVQLLAGWRRGSLPIADDESGNLSSGMMKQVQETMSRLKLSLIHI